MRKIRSVLLIVLCVVLAYAMCSCTILYDETGSESSQADVLERGMPQVLDDDIDDEISLGECEHKTTGISGAVSSSCTKAGYTGDRVCAECGALIEKGETIPASGHAEKLTDKLEPTCTKAGYTGDRVCAECGEILEKGTSIPAKGHSESTVNKKEATVGEEGYTGDTICTTCGALLKKGHETTKVVVPDRNETGNGLVWVPTKGGTKYHCSKSCSNMIDPMQVTVETAEANGYTKCKKCYH